MRLALLLLVLLWSSVANATSYYVANDGSDLANGTATLTAWQTVAKVNASSFTAGDTIYFRRGDTWRETLTVPSSGSSSNAYVTFDAYGTGSNPTFIGSDIVANAAFAADSGLAYSTSYSLITNGVMMVYEDGVRLTSRASQALVQNNAGSFFLSGTTLYVSATDSSNVSTNGKTYEVPGRHKLIYTNGKSYVKLTHLTATRTSGDDTTYGSVVISGSNNLVDAIDSHDARRHPLQILCETSIDSAGNTVQNSTLYDSWFTFVVSVFAQATTCTTSGNLVILNTIYNPASNSVGNLLTVHGADGTHQPSTTTVRGNVFIGLGTSTNQATEFYDVAGLSVIGNWYYGTFNSNPVYIHLRGTSIVFADNFVNLSGTIATADGVFISDITGVQVNNNVFYGTNGRHPIRYSTNASSGVVTNNIFHTTSKVIRVEATAQASFVSNYNDAYNITAGATWGQWGATEYTFANWKTNSSQDANTVTTDPAFWSLNTATWTASNFHTFASANLQRAGLTWAGCLDANGQTCWNPPDIGPLRSSNGSAAADLWYLRPASACSYNGDGTAYACAASAGATGAWISGDVTNLDWSPTLGVDDGDTLYICGAHTTRAYVGGSGAGTVTSPIVVSWSCPSDRGSITAVTAMPEALTSGNWTLDSGNVWYLSVASYTYPNPKRIWLDGTEQFAALDKASITASAQFWYDSGTTRIYLYRTANPATTFSLMESLVAGSSTASYAAFAIAAEANDYIDVVNPILAGGNLGSLFIAGADNIRVYGTTTDDLNCTIGNKASQGIFITDSSTAGTGTNSSSGTIHDCTIDQGLPAGFPDPNDSDGDAINLAYGVDGWLITSNTINSWSHANYNITATVGTGIVSNNTFSLNTVRCASTIQYCRGFGLDGTAVGRATGNIIKSNTFDNFAIRSQFNGDANYLIGNIFSNQRQSTESTQKVQMLDMEGYTGSVSQNNVILNNTFVNNPYGPCISFRAGANTKSGFVVENNLLVNCGGTVLTGYENTALVVQNAASVGNQTFKNNLIYTSGQSNTVYYKATGKTTVSGFQSACSGDTCSGNLSSDPLVIGVYALNLGSPAYHAGLSVSNCVDVLGHVCQSPPNIGAYQASGRALAQNRTLAGPRTLRSNAGAGPFLLNEDGSKFSLEDSSGFLLTE